MTTDVQGDTRIWSTQTCQGQTQLIGQLSRVVSADFSFDDQYVVTAGADRTARIFSLPDGTLQATLLGHTEALTSVAYSPDGTKVVSAAADGTSRVWDASIDRPEQLLGTQGTTASAVAVSPDGSTLASVGAEGWLRLWSLGSRTPLSQLSVGVAARGRRVQCGREARRRRGRGRDDPRLEQQHARARHPVLTDRTRACAGAVTRRQVAGHGRHRQRGPRLRDEGRRRADQPDQHGRR